MYCTACGTARPSTSGPCPACGTPAPVVAPAPAAGAGMVGLRTTMGGSTAQSPPPSGPPPAAPSGPSSAVPVVSAVPMGAVPMVPLVVPVVPLVAPAGAIGPALPRAGSDEEAPAASSATVIVSAVLVAALAVALGAAHFLPLYRGGPPTVGDAVSPDWLLFRLAGLAFVALAPILTRQVHVVGVAAGATLALAVLLYPLVDRRAYQGGVDFDLGSGAWAILAAIAVAAAAVIWCLASGGDDRRAAPVWVPVGVVSGAAAWVIGGYQILDRYYGFGSAAGDRLTSPAFQWFAVPAIVGVIAVLAGRRRLGGLAVAAGTGLGLLAIWSAMVFPRPSQALVPGVGAFAMAAFGAIGMLAAVDERGVRRPFSWMAWLVLGAALIIGGIGLDHFT